AADLRRERVAQIIAVQVQGRDDIKIFRPGEDLLEGDVSDGVFDDDARAGFAFGNLAPRSAIQFRRAEVLFGGLIAPVAEGAFGELHDVALVHDRHALALELDRVTNRAVDQSHAAAVAHRFDADADADVGRKILRADGFPELLRLLFRAKADFIEVLGKFFGDEIQNFLRLGRAAGVFDTGVNILGIFAEEDHVHFFRMLHGRRNAGEVLNGPEADVEVEHLTERHVERADAAAHRRGERTFDADEEFLERIDGVVGQPVVELLESGFACEHFEPGGLAFAAVGLVHGGVEHALTGGPDVRPRAVAADKREDWVVRNVKFAVLNGDFATGRRSAIFV